MAISGLVITLSADPADAAGVLARLACDGRLDLGERFGRRLAAVAETPGVESDRELIDDLRASPGIENVDVTFVHLDSPQACSIATPAGAAHRPHSREETHAQH